MLGGQMLMRVWNTPAILDILICCQNKYKRAGKQPCFLVFQGEDRGVSHNMLRVLPSSFSILLLFNLCFYGFLLPNHRIFKSSYFKTLVMEKIQKKLFHVLFLISWNSASVTCFLSLHQSITYTFVLYCLKPFIVYCNSNQCLTAYVLTGNR